jgi:hypothetical protein
VAKERRKKRFIINENKPEEMIESSGLKPYQLANMLRLVMVKQI